MLIAPSPEPACLLMGTMVKTLNGYIPIETIKVGDTVISHKNTRVKVLEVGKWKCDLKKDRTDLVKRMYKIPAGKYDAETDVYLSHYHRILTDGYWLRIPKNLGFKEADPAEFAIDGKYNIYHLRVENGLDNHLVVNGGCAVESWTDI